ncbi:UNVERIFIED_CONTAM: hypothetical protein FKN15_020895 [Acipenser sinensis]
MCSIIKVLERSLQPVQADAENRTEVRKVGVPPLYCKAKIPPEDKHTLCAQCLGVQHATLTLKRAVTCIICAAFQPRVRENRLEKATRMSSASSVAGQSAALGAPEPLLHDLSQDTLLDIPDTQAPSCCPPSPQARRVKLSKLGKDVMDLKAQMAQVLELLAKQTPTAPTTIPPPPPLPQWRSGWMERGVPAGARGHAFFSGLWGWGLLLL